MVFERREKVRRETIRNKEGAVPPGHDGIVVKRRQPDYDEERKA
jgi:hypothetical protein